MNRTLLLQHCGFTSGYDLFRTGQFELVVDFEITGGDPSNPNFWITLEDDQGNTFSGILTI